MEEQEQFVVDNDGKAEWALRKIAEELKDSPEIPDSELTETQRLIRDCNREIEDYKLKKERLQKQVENKVAYFKGLLNGYFLTVPHKETKTQESYSLPSGKLVLKYPKPKFDVDNDKLADFLIVNGYNDFVEETPKAKWGEFKKTVAVLGEKVIDANGQIVEGVSVEMTQPEFEVEI